MIGSARSRNAPPNPMDAYDHRALDGILQDLEPLFTWSAGGPLRTGDAVTEDRI